MRANLTEYFCRCNQLEQLGQRMRVCLATNPYAQIQSIFQRLDKFQKGYLIPSDLSEFMLDNQIYPSESQLYLIFKSFDKQRQGIITLKELQQQLLPKQNQTLRKEVLLRKAYPITTRLAIDAEFLLARYFHHKIKEFSILNRLVGLMTHQYHNFMLQQAFKALDCTKKGHLSGIADLDIFFRHNGKQLHHLDLIRIYRIITESIPGAVINSEILEQHLTPLKKGMYPHYETQLQLKQVQQKSYLEKQYNLKNEQIYHNNMKEEMIRQIDRLSNSNRKLERIMLEQGQQKSISYF